MQTGTPDITLIAGWIRQYDAEGHLLPARFPLGIASLVSALRLQGYQAEVRDIQFSSEPPVPALLEAFENAAPIIGISCMSDFLPPVLFAVTQYKSEHSDTTFILGGPGPTGVADYIMSSFPAVDIIVKGEGELPLVGLLDSLRNHSSLHTVPGILYRHNEQVYTNPRGERLRTLDALYPLPLDAFDIEGYHRSWPITTSRGCPYDCSFCDVVGLWGRTISWRSLDNVFMELHELAQRRTTSVAFVDDTFVIKRARVETLCKRMNDEQISLTWHCNGRINLIDERLLIQMLEGGCRSIFFGVESGSDRILGRINKAFTVDEAERVINLTSRYLQTTVSFIWGFPFETFEDFQATWRLAKRLSEKANVSVHLFLLAPLPFAPIHQEYGASIIFDPHLRSGLNRHQLLSADEIDLVRHYPEIFPSFWIYPTEQLKDKLQWLTQNPLP